MIGDQRIFPLSPFKDIEIQNQTSHTQTHTHVNLLLLLLGQKRSNNIMMNPRESYVRPDMYVQIYTLSHSVPSLRVSLIGNNGSPFFQRAQNRPNE